MSTEHSTVSNSTYCPSVGEFLYQLRRLFKLYSLRDLSVRGIKGLLKIVFMGTEATGLDKYR